MHIYMPIKSKSQNLVKLMQNKCLHHSFFWLICIFKLFAYFIYRVVFYLLSMAYILDIAEHNKQNQYTHEVIFH